MFQFFNLIGNLSVADNVELPGLLDGLSAKEARTRRRTSSTTLGIAEHADSVPHAALRRPAAAGRDRPRADQPPEVLLADEPTGNLDCASARDVMALLREAHDERGQTIVLVTHDARVAARADRVLAMRDGDRRPRDAPGAGRRQHRLPADAAGGVSDARRRPPPRPRRPPRAARPDRADRGRDLRRRDRAGRHAGAARRARRPVRGRAGRRPAARTSPSTAT